MCDWLSPAFTALDGRKPRERKPGWIDLDKKCLQRDHTALSVPVSNGEEWKEQDKPNFNFV